MHKAVHLQHHTINIESQSESSYVSFAEKYSDLEFICKRWQDAFRIELVSVTRWVFCSESQSNFPLYFLLVFSVVNRGVKHRVCSFAPGGISMHEDIVSYGAKDCPVVLSSNSTMNLRKYWIYASEKVKA